MTSHGQTVRLFLVEGTATGILTAEIMNWTGHLLAAPRSKLVDALRREEPKKTGFYLLVGPDPENPNRSRVYVGEGDNVGERLKAHAKDPSKEFWTRMFVITSKDTNLTKSHVRYLENRLVALAKSAGRASVANGNDPAPKQLPESDIADMEFFLDQTQLMLPVVGVDLFREKPTLPKSGDEAQVAADGLELILESKKHNITASAVEKDGEVTVLEGSTATAKDDFTSNTYSSLRKSLLDDGLLRPSDDGEALVFTAAVTFPSPSAAAAVIFNRNSNGRTSWKVRSSGKTLKDWQDEQLDVV